MLTTIHELLISRASYMPVNVNQVFVRRMKPFINSSAPPSRETGHPPHLNKQHMSLELTAHQAALRCSQACRKPYVVFNGLSTLPLDHFQALFAVGTGRCHGRIQSPH